MSLPIPGLWLQAVEAASYLAPPPLPRDGLRHPGGGGASVLIVEEDQELRSLLTLLIGAAGFRVYTARDEAEGRKFFRGLLPGAVVTDVDNESLDGAALSRMIRSEEPGKPTPIVVLTSGTAIDEDGIFSVDKRAGLGGLLHALIHLLPAS
jgi:CheY-like chemotaxis protein